MALDTRARRATRQARRTDSRPRAAHSPRVSSLVSNLRHVKAVDPEIYQAILDELRRQQEQLELIASENFTSPAVLEAQGSVLTNKYAEGYPNARWYDGCQYVDVAEQLAIDRAKQLFGAEHVNVQPHSGSQANMAALFAILQPGDTMMAMDLACGGHLTHGHPANFSGKYFKVIPYGVRRDNELLDFDQIEALAKEHKPKLIMAGYTAYPRIIEFERFRQICDAVGAIFMVDIAHIAGLVAAGLHPNPVPIAEIVTTTTHKTLRGPRAGMIMCQKAFAKKINAAVFPGIQGGPLEHVIAAKAVALKEALQPAFKVYQQQIVKNSRAMAASLSELGYRIVSGGSDTHLVLVDLTRQGVTGRDAAKTLDHAGITVNKNLIPYDPQPPAVASGIRVGTPAVTTRGMKEREMAEIARLIDEVVQHWQDEAVIAKVREKVHALTAKFPLYP